VGSLGLNADSSELTTAPDSSLSSLSSLSSPLFTVLHPEIDLNTTTLALFPWVGPDNPDHPLPPGMPWIERVAIIKKFITGMLSGILPRPPLLGRPHGRPITDQEKRLVSIFMNKNLVGPPPPPLWSTWSCCSRGGANHISCRSSR
jgi:hypothetical protein